MRPAFLHIRNTLNLGDRACCPADGFSDFDDCERLDWRDWKTVAEGAPIILGGGGLFMQGFPEWLEKVNLLHPVAVWGAGLNYPHAAFTPEESKKLRAALHRCHGPVGIRNPRFARRHGFEYVPCASAMSSAFDEGVESQDRLRGLCAYEHGDKRFAGSRYAAITNMGDSFQQAIQFLSRAQCVVTNSYHGAYWSQLLEKQVLLWRPDDFGNRFEDGFLEGLPECRTFADVEVARVAREVKWPPPLLSSRVDNHEFFCKIQDWLGNLQK